MIINSRVLIYVYRLCSQRDTQAYTQTYTYMHTRVYTYECTDMDTHISMIVNIQLGKLLLANSMKKTIVN